MNTTRSYSALLALACLAPLAAAAAPVPGTSCNVLPVDNVWNTDISTLPVHASSAAWLATMNAGTKNLHPDFGAAPYGMPFIVVDNSHARVSVTFDYADESDPGPYPFDGQTPIEGGAGSGGDQHAFMINQDSCVLYELYFANWNNGAPTAGSGAIFDLNANGPLRPAGWTSADAAGLPIFPGLVRYDEVQAGAINHAIRFTTVRTDRSYLWPARHQAGNASNPNYPPMGARFRLKASYNISSYSPQAQVILTAMKHYGVILADNGSDWFFTGTEDSRWGDDVLNGLKSVPASQFEAVDESSLMLNPDSGQARQIPLNGPAASLSVSALNFGNQTTGTTSATQSVTLRNVGNANLTVSSVTVSGANAGDFSVATDSCSTGTLAPNGTCSVSVRFAPTAAGARSASLRFADNAPDTPQTVALSGTGVAPAPGITLTPPSLDFGKVAFNQQSAVKTITVNSTGAAPLNLSGVAVTGKNAKDFSVVSNTCSGAQLAPGTSCAISLRFKPGLVGARSASLVVSDNAAGGQHVAALSGSGSVAGLP